MEPGHDAPVEGDGSEFIGRGMRLKPMRVTSATHDARFYYMHNVYHIGMLELLHEVSGENLGHFVYIFSAKIQRHIPNCGVWRDPRMY